MTIRSIGWRHLRFDAVGDATQLSVLDTRESRVLGSLRVELVDPWRPAGATFLDDEIEWHWSHPGGGRALARMTAGTNLVLRMSVTAPRDAALESPPPVLSWTGRGPVRAWLGGSSALAILDERPSDGLVVAAVLTGGHASGGHGQQDAADDELSIACGPQPICLSAAGSSSCTWVLRIQPDVASAMSLFPPWMPSTITPAAGEPVRFDLPDAVLISDARTSTDERGTEVFADAGHHDVTLRGPGLDCTLTLTWNAGGRAMLTERALALLRGTDPRTAGAAQAALIDRAAAEGLLPNDEARDYLEVFCQELLDRRPSSPGPLAVPVLIHRASGSADLLDEVLGVVGQLSPGPEAMLGWMAAGIAARGAELPFTTRPPVDPDDPLCIALHDILVRAERPSASVWRSTAWLHGPFPQSRPAAGRLRSALACVVLSLTPPGWHLEERLGVGVLEEIEDTRAWLAADPLSDAELAWLVWS